MRAFVFLAAAFQLTDNQVFALLAATLDQEYWPDGGDASWLLVAYPLGAALGPCLLTQLAPSVKARAVVTVSLVTLAALQFTMALAPTFALALGCRGIAGAASGILSYALLIEAVRAGDRTVTFMTAGFLLAYVLGIPSAAAVAATVGLPTLFTALGVAAALLAASAQILLPTSATTQHTDTPRPFRHFLASHRYRSGLITSMLIGAALAGPVAVFPQLLTSTGGMGLNDVAWVYYLGGVGPILALPFVPRLIQALGMARTCTLGALTLVPALLAMPLGAHGTVIAGCLLMLALAVETVRRTALQAHMGGLAPEQDRPRYLALRNVAVQVSVSGGVAGAILVRDGAGFMATCVLAAALAAASARWVPKVRTRDAVSDGA